jgi:ATP/maltotriose-dependent transcriptional regulator MalT
MEGMAGHHERVFVGRGAEVATCSAALDAASSGRSTVIAVEGAAGSGKSALVRHVAGLASPDVRVVRLEAEQIAADVPFALVGQIGETGEGGPFPAGLRLLERFGPSSSTGRTLVVVEDLHWSDTPSRHALLTAARRMGDEGVVMVVTSRRGELVDEGWMRFVADTDRCIRIELDPFSASDIGELATRAGVALTAEGVERLRQHTLGHPLYVRTVLDELKTAGTVDPDLGLPVPRSLSSTTLARLAGVSAEARELACALAVLNQRIPLALAGRVAGLAEPSAALDELLERQLVVWWPALPFTPIEFAHPLYGQAVAEDLSPTRRQALHRLAAQVVDDAAALAHRVAAADGFDDLLADEVAARAERDAAGGGLGGPARLLLWASALSSDGPARDARLLRAAQLLLRDGQTARVASLRDRIEACASSPARHLVLGTLAWQQGDARTTVDELLHVAPRGDETSDEAAAALALLGIVYSFQGRTRRALAAGERVVTMRPRDPSVERDGWTSLVVAEASLRGPLAGLERLGARLPDDVDQVAAADADLLVIRGMLGFYAGRIARPAADIRAAVRLSSASAGTRAHLHLAQLLFRSGQPEEALAQGRLALSFAADERQVWMQAQIHAALAQILATRGDAVAAADHAARAHGVAAALPTPEAVVTTRISDGASAFTSFDTAGVIAALSPLSAQTSDSDASLMMPLDWWSMLVIALLDDERIADAADERERFRAAVGRAGLDHAGALVEMDARVAWAAGDRERALDLFAESIASPSERSFLDIALLRHAYGEALHATGQRQQALEQLRVAHDHYAQLGAEPFRRRVEPALQAAGIKASRTKRNLLDLTEREQDVVALVATGMTNREVAAALYVSDKAVEYHLKNIFGKLGVSSRRELRSHDSRN